MDTPLQGVCPQSGYCQAFKQNKASFHRVLPLGVVGVFMALSVVMGSWMHTYLQTHQVVRIKYFLIFYVDTFCMSITF